MNNNGKIILSFKNYCIFFSFNKKLDLKNMYLNFKSKSETILSEFESSETYNILQLNLRTKSQNHLRNKRQLFKYIGDMICALFGTISLNDIVKFYTNINNMIKNGRKFQSIIENKMMITPASTNDAIILNKKTIESQQKFQII